VLTEEKLNEVGAGLEHSSQKSLTRLLQEPEVSSLLRCRKIPMHECEIFTEAQGMRKNWYCFRHLL
jgi:hypothetical protein